MRTIARISYREQARGGDVRDEPRMAPANALTRSRHVVLLIHGFNNNQDVALASYRAFLEQQSQLGGMNGQVVGVYWPGDTGVLNYHLSIPRAQETARKLAVDLSKAATLRGELVIDVVAHSMGCRLTLEVLRELGAVAESPIKVHRIIFMAAAVPIRRLGIETSTDGRQLRDALVSGDVRILSLFSRDDLVLRVAFPMGQNKADKRKLDESGAPPVALGYSRWRSADAVRAPRLTQIEATNCGHGHYWPNKSGAIAPAVRQFLSSQIIERKIVERELTTRNTFSRRVANGLRRFIRVRETSSG